NPFFASTNYSPPQAPFWPNGQQLTAPAATTNPFLVMGGTNQAAQNNQFTQHLTLPTFTRAIG
uniref:Period n=1 Tax=Romanomermis culicivorax TaxID=13658 RepID=A0A915IIP8_ROMCU